LQKRGQIYFDKRLYADSISNLTTLLEIEPKNYDALILRARAKMSAGMNAEALSDIDAALAQRPNEAYAHSLRGAAYLDADWPRSNPARNMASQRRIGRAGLLAGRLGRSNVTRGQTSLVPSKSSTRRCG